MRKTHMLRAAICCLMLAATAAMAWVTLPTVGTQNGTGTRIIGGRDYTGYHPYVWGVFPNSGDSRTHYGHARVDQTDPTWELDNGTVIPYLDYTSVAFQREDNGRFFFSGHGSNGNKLYLCDLNNWYPTTVDLPVAPGAGSCIAYVPYGNDAGWVYYLSQSNGGQFWSYSLISADNVVVDGICPGESAIIGNSTPLFQWGDVAATQYRLLVSTDSLFGDTLIDEVVSSPQFQATAGLANDAYYWRSAALAGATWAWSVVRTFHVDVGWSVLSSRSDNTHGGVGASMAYLGNFDDNDHSAILLLVGGGTYQFWEYNLKTSSWNQLTSTPSSYPYDYPQYEGTSLTTMDPTGCVGACAWASFGGQQATEDFPWVYAPGDNVWSKWDVTGQGDLRNSHYLETITDHASMAFGEPGMVYLITGDREFFKLDPPTDDSVIKWVAEGQLSSGSSAASTRARVITCNCGFGVEYQLSKAAHVHAVLRDAVGRQVGVLDVGEQNPGLHRLSWSADGEGRKLSAGAYFVLLETGAERARLKAIVR